MSAAKPPKLEPTRSYTYSLKPVVQLVRPIIKKVLPQKSVIFQQLFDLWPDVTAGTEAENTIPEKITFARGQQKSGCLALWVQSGAQATEIMYNKTQLIQRINAVFGYALIEDVRVTAHPTLIKKKAVSTQGKTGLKVNSARGVPSQSLDKILGDISNPALKSMLGELGGFLDPNTPSEPTEKTTQQR